MKEAVGAVLTRAPWHLHGRQQWCTLEASPDRKPLHAIGAKGWKFFNGLGLVKPQADVKYSRDSVILWDQRNEHAPVRIAVRKAATGWTIQAAAFAQSFPGKSAEEARATLSA